MSLCTTSSEADIAALTAAGYTGFPTTGTYRQTVPTGVAWLEEQYVIDLFFISSLSPEQCGDAQYAETVTSQ